MPTTRARTCPSRSRPRSSSGSARTGDVTYTDNYYTLAHFSRFTRPGATRIAASVAAAEGDTAPVQASAFTNPDGSTALVLHNPSTTVAHTTTISAPGVHVTTKVAPDSTVTYTWARP
ncbi:glycoside hydrolase family 30 beta sandwich domain-containing protein [Streptomyces sp. RKAG290]|uniref:glycoside hydrolase family 30 beta sandwich domain-containing protein n=1 Tax=Streptomyces sp. RKAG290 TaxID=2888348 RepID=UPI002033BEF3|nr:glycoside hydrolase family 30 beta sandwich domain-containing protein [Streptomyces sp. RKAG290]MCM2416186.1 hypothetical protein [Streptomyces sp. RKAG290]